MRVSNCDQCQQVGHLFNAPLCRSQSLIKRIANVVFHILTLGIPFVLYHVLMYCFKGCPSEIDIGHLHKKYLENIRLGFVDRPPISELGKKIITEAYNEVSLKQNLEMYDTTSIPEGGPLNDQLSKLITLRQKFNIQLQEKVKELSKAQQNPWESKEVLQIADHLIKLSYAVGMSMLEELPSYRKQLMHKQKKTYSFAQILYNIGFYHQFSFYALPEAYLACRTAMYLKGDVFRFRVNKDIPEVHSQKFYIEGELFFTWRMLYNEYCERVRYYASDEELGALSNLLIQWTQIDQDYQTFDGMRKTPHYR